MCGIVGSFDLKLDMEQQRSQVLKMSKKIRHRGPDWSGIFSDEKAILSHERLAIVDPQSGVQPLYSEDESVVLAVNGEIYNHLDLKKNLDIPYNFKTNSDCEIILPLFQQYGSDFLDKLNGIFAFILYDKKTGDFLVGRDHIGIIPLYYGYDKKGQIYFASELKSLEGICNTIEEFLPGMYMEGKDKIMKKWYSRDWSNFEAVKDSKIAIDELRESLESAVHRQMMTDVPYGVLLSGGLDSSVISAIVNKYSKNRIEEGDSKEAWWPRLHSFAVGLKGSPDLSAAQKVADYLGTVHHEINFTVQEGLDALRDVIYHLETYDVTTVRASTPMYLMARVIKSMGIKMVLSGEGSDEIFGGYLYFHKAPDAEELHAETVRKISKLHQYDCLRANKSMAAWGIECRVPFLDKEFMDVAMSVNPNDKMITAGKMEKHILREAFQGYLPEEVLWRQKEQFSDGVGYSWIDSLKELVDKKVTPEMMDSARFKFPINTPHSKEEYYYRTIFEEHFPSQAAAKCVPSVPSIACSSEVALKWDASFQNNADPSGRAVVNIHVMDINNK